MFFCIGQGKVVDPASDDGVETVAELLQRLSPAAAGEIANAVSDTVEAALG